MSARIALCGARYGSTYLRGLAGAPDVSVAAVVGRGSASSRAQAERHGVAYATDPASVTEVDAAVVAVGGQAGVGLAEHFLQRGVPVLQEHPVGAGPAEHLLAVAASRGVPWHLNSHFADLPSTRPWWTGVHQLLGTGAPFFVTLVCNPRTLFSALDILGRALGRLGPMGPWQRADDGGFNVVALGRCAGVSVTVICQRTVSAVDDGSASVSSHNLQIGFAEGVLELGDMGGPVVWRPSLSSRAVMQGGAALWDVPPPREPLSVTAFQASRDTASADAVRTLLATRSGTPPPFWQTPNYLHELTRVWEAATAAIGPPVVLPERVSPRG